MFVTVCGKVDSVTAIEIIDVLSKFRVIGETLEIEISDEVSGEDSELEIIVLPDEGLIELTVDVSVIELTVLCSELVVAISIEYEFGIIELGSSKLDSDIGILGVVAEI